MHPMTLELIAALEKLSDPKKATQMQAYMKTTQEFYGVQAGPRRKAFKAVAKGFKAISHQTYEQIIFELWGGRCREDMYQALETAEHYKAYRTPESWPVYERLVKSATNWDTLDWVSGRLISPLLLKHREFEPTLVEWSVSENFWVRRASLLAHLRHKEQTNTRLLADTILRLCHEQEFFIRKAIGWVLRNYARTDPDWVRAFVDEHQERLSGLSKREALKHLK